MKNFKMNKKKLFSLLLAGGICLSNITEAEIFSYNKDVFLKNGEMAKLYFTKNVDNINYAYISSRNMVGFIYEDDLYLDNIVSNNYYIEDNSSIMVTSDIAYIYQTPNIDNRVVGILNKNDLVNLMAKSIDGWYVVYVNGISGFMHESCFIEKKSDDISIAKITGNNVNVRSSSTTKDNNIIGFADVSDTFKIINKENNWYIIDYLGQNGYISSKYVREVEVNKADMEYKRVAYIPEDSYFYTDLNTLDGIILPAYQNVLIIDEYNDYYKVKVDGVVGYIKKNNVKRLTNTCVIVDLARQILKIYKNGNEIYRTHIISGRKSMPTQIGCFKIGHKVMGYQLTPDNYVDYWIQYDGNRGIHDASWQKDKYYLDVASHAYDDYASGYGKTYPYQHGSHGCDNMKLIDVIEVYRLVNVNDNVLVIGPNDLIKEKLISKNNLLEEEKVLVKRYI